VAVASAEHMQICISPQTDSHASIPPLRTKETDHDLIHFKIFNFVTAKMSKFVA